MHKVRSYIFTAVIILSVILLFSGCLAKLPKLMEEKAKSDVLLEDRNVGGLRESEILEIIENHAEKFDKVAVDADFNENTWEIYPEILGKKINVEETLKAVLNAEEGEKVNFEVEKTEPEITSEMLKNTIVEIGSYSTPLLDDSESRVNNIQIAAENINYYKIMPGEVFSFNEALGKRTQSKGYEKAPIIIKTEEGPKKGFGVGGGVCQLSSTLYNAVKEAGLEVTERHSHSKKVGYVPKGEDATVSYGSADFKFRNNKDYPIMIKISVSKGRVTAVILEKRS